MLLFMRRARGAARRTARRATRPALGAHDLHGREDLRKRGTFALGAFYLALSRNAGEFFELLSAFLAFELIGRHGGL